MYFTERILHYQEKYIIIESLNKNLTINIPSNCVTSGGVDLLKIINKIYKNINIYSYLYLHSLEDRKNIESNINKSKKLLNDVFIELTDSGKLYSKNEYINNIIKICIDLSINMLSFQNDIHVNVLFETFCYQYKKIITMINHKNTNSIIFKEINKIRNSIDHNNLIFETVNNELYFYDYQKDTEILYNKFYIEPSGRINIYSFSLFYLTLLTSKDFELYFRDSELYKYINENSHYEVSILNNYLQYRSCIYEKLNPKDKVAKLRKSLIWFENNGHINLYPIDLFHIYRHIGFELVLSINDRGGISTKEEADIRYDALRHLVEAEKLLNLIDSIYNFIFLYKKSLYINISDIYYFYRKKKECLSYAIKAVEFLENNPENINNEMDLIRAYGNIANAYSIDTVESPADYAQEKIYIEKCLKIIDQVKNQNYSELSNLKRQLLINLLSSCSSSATDIPREYYDNILSYLSDKVKFDLKRDILINLALYHYKLKQFSDSKIYFKKITNNKKFKIYERYRAELYLLLIDYNLGNDIDLKKIDKIKNKIKTSNDLLENEKNTLISLSNDLISLL